MMFLLENNIALEIYARRTLRIENLEICPLLESILFTADWEMGMPSLAQ